MSPDKGDAKWHRRGRINRRNLMKIGAAAGVMSAAGCITTARAQGEAEDGSEETDGSEGVPEARNITPREVNNYHAFRAHRPQIAEQVLLSDPRANEVVSEWIGDFEAYEPLTDYLETVSVMGSQDVQIEGGMNEWEWDVTVFNRQVIYGLVNRAHNELVALEITDPEDEASWTLSYDEEEARSRVEFVLDQPEIAEILDGADWYPHTVMGFQKVASGFGRPKADIDPVIIHAYDGEEMFYIDAWLDVTEEPESYEFLDHSRVDRTAEIPVRMVADQVRTREETVLGKVPEVPAEMRPAYTREDGYHGIDLPDNSFEQNNWQLEWEETGADGVAIQAEFNGKPVFDKVACMAAYTAYGLPARNGANTFDWLFPDFPDDPAYAGEQVFWDMFGPEFGGPGALEKIDFPPTNNNHGGARVDHPGGFRFRSHYHPAGQGPTSIDVHSGLRYFPYNYDISFEFFEDGVFKPVWLRNGPGFVMKHRGHEDMHEGPVQWYIAAYAMDVTPGTTDGATVEVFDGDEWTRPEEEFYLPGSPEKMVQFCNPGDGDETIKMPLEDAMELVVVRPKEDEIGRHSRWFEPEIEHAFVHPAQYVDGEPIQGERVIAWYLMEISVDELPYHTGPMTFAAEGKVDLQNY